MKYMLLILINLLLFLSSWACRKFTIFIWLIYQTSQDLEKTLYIGKSEYSIRDKLLNHLHKSSNTNLREVIVSERPLQFYWYEFPNPSYDEALEILRLQRAGLLKKQTNRKYPVVTYLDFD